MDNVICYNRCTKGWKLGLDVDLHTQKKHIASKMVLWLITAIKKGWRDGLGKITRGEVETRAKEQTDGA